jgi:hypothetical protein
MIPFCVFKALRINCVAFCAFATALRSNEYTKTPESRKNLSPIHFVPAQLPARIDMLQVFHQPVETLGVYRALCERREPFAERRIRCPALPARHRPRPLY